MAKQFTPDSSRGRAMEPAATSKYLDGDTNDAESVHGHSLSRRTFLASGGAALIMAHRAFAQSGTASHPVKEYDVVTNGITLHVTEQGQGPVVLFCHGFPDTSYSWRHQMKALADAGYRAIAPDMRGFGGSSAPADFHVYTPPFTVGDMVGLLEAIHVPTAVVVGHDWGAGVAWSAALMRPDIFTAVFCLSIPYFPRGDMGDMAYMRKTGHEHDFYIFEQASPEADQIWADAAVTIPGVLYWASASAPAAQRWSPFHPERSLYRKAPGPLPAWADPNYVAHNIATFQRTGFHGGLNYYRQFESSFDLSAAYKGAKITQPSFYMSGKADGLDELFPQTEAQMRAGLPGLVAWVQLDNVGHWIQHEASTEVNTQLIQFLRTVKAT